MQYMLVCVCWTRVRAGIGVRVWFVLCDLCILYLTGQIFRIGTVGYAEGL